MATLRQYALGVKLHTLDRQGAMTEAHNNRASMLLSAGCYSQVAGERIFLDD